MRNGGGFKRRTDGGFCVRITGGFATRISGGFNENTHPTKKKALETFSEGVFV